MNQSQSGPNIIQQKPKLSYAQTEKEQEQKELTDQFMKNPRISRQRECFERNGLMNYFFQIPEVKQQGEALRIQMLSGIPSELLFEQQPMEQNNIKLFRLTKEVRKQILRQFPEVNLAYEREVPRNRGENDFWKMFFKSYVIERNEKKDDTNMFYKYLQEYERDHVQEAPSRKLPLEISLENDANDPCDSNWEAYEPQDNEDTQIEEHFRVIRDKLVLHINNIEAQISAQSKSGSNDNRGDVLNADTSSEQHAKRFSQNSSVLGYNELMRQQEKKEEGSQRVVSDSERQLFIKNLQGFKKNIPQCMERPENREYINNQIEEVERDVNETKEMKEHNAIPEQIEHELLKAQYNVYCMMHFAIWLLTQNRVIKGDYCKIIDEVVKPVYNEIEYNKRILRNKFSQYTDTFSYIMNDWDDLFNRIKLIKEIAKQRYMTQVQRLIVCFINYGKKGVLVELPCCYKSMFRLALI